jgi:hypothetical protein
MIIFAIQHNIMDTITTFSKMAFADIADACITPNVQHIDPGVNSLDFGYVDADEEMRAIAKYICGKVASKDNVDVDRIKFLYTSKPKKEGGRNVAGYLISRSDIERIVDDKYDYIICVYYHAWKDFDAKTKVIQLDKLMCGIDVEIDLEQKRNVKKNQTDIREFQENINYFGATEVITSSEIVDLAVASAMDRVKQEKKEQNG